MFQLKRRNLLYLFLIFSLLIKLSLQQGFLIPFFNFNLDDEEEEEEETKEKEFDDGLKPVFEKRVYTYNDNGTPVTVTQISYKSRNLGKNNKNKNLITPFEIMRNFDRRVNSIFEDFFKESIGIRNILSEMEKDEEEFEKRIKKDFFGENNELNNDNEENDKEDNDDKNKEGDYNKSNEKKKKLKRIGKITFDDEKVKDAINKNKKKKKLSKRQLIFSRICKYVFYSIILFTVYLMVKKLLEFLEIIDPEGIVEVKINNEPDEESINLKKSENKQN